MAKKKDLVVGACLGDMHGSSFAYLKSVIEGVNQPTKNDIYTSQLLRYIKKIHRVISFYCENPHCAIEQMLGTEPLPKGPHGEWRGEVPIMTVGNKLVYIAGYTTEHGLAVLAYAYDGSYLGLCEAELNYDATAEEE